MSKLVEFLDFFKDLEDPRIDRKKLHPIPEILLLTLCGVISGCDGWSDIEEFGKSKLESLRDYLPYSNGIPSDDTMRRFFRAMDPKSFSEKFREWVKSLGKIGEQVIALDGKTSKGSRDGDKKPLHLVSAFASESRLVLAQRKVDEKSNEITAIPELLEWLDLRGATITIDAMGCQKSIAEKINHGGGDYVFSLKGNHGQLHEDVRFFFEGADKKDLMNSESVDGEHGRVEIRRCFVTEEIEWLANKEKWPGLKSIVLIESEREEKGKKSLERRCYLSSLPADAQRHLKVIRSHWLVESMHWVLDMSFGEDQSRIRKGNAPENIAIIRHFALNLLQKYKKERQSIKRLRKMSGWNNSIMQGILAHAN